MKAQVLIDNISNSRLKSEWGLSILIEEKDKKVLLDFGASDKFLSNVKKMGLDLTDIDISVLSHAHFDHGNGIPFFLEMNKKAKVYMSSNVKENCYTRENIRKVYEGIPKGTLDKYGDRIIFTNGKTEICEDFYLLSHKKPYEGVGKQEAMFFKTESGWIYDDLLHEHTLIVDTENGLVIFSPCSHIGAYNIIEEVKDAFPNKKIYAIIGGFHLYNKDRAYVLNFGEKLKETGIEHIYTGHCTGNKAYDVLNEVLGDKLHKIETGLVIEF